MYGLPHATVRRYLLNQVLKPGKLGRYVTALNADFETELVQYATEMQ